MQLTWKRQAWSGTYYASTDTHKFAVDQPVSTWRLRVWVKPDVGQTQAGYIHYDDGFVTMADAKAAARQFADQATR